MAKPTPRANAPRTLVEALVALATRDGLGDTVDWDDVRAAMSALLADPIGPRDLRAVVARLNDPSVPATLDDWFTRAAAEREGDAKAALRGAEKLLQPLQMVTLGIAASASLALATGAAIVTIGSPIVVGALIVAGVATYGRWLLSKRSDDALGEATAIRGLAAIVRK